MECRGNVLQHREKIPPIATKTKEHRINSFDSKIRRR